MKQKLIGHTVRSLLYSVLYAGICLSATLGCSREDGLAEGAGAEPGGVYITLKINVPGGSAPFTRALSIEDESGIDNLQVLVFNEHDEFCYQASTNLNTGADGAVSARVLLKQSSAAGENYHLVMLANAATVSPAPSAGDLKMSVLNKVVFNATADGLPGGTPGLPHISGTRLPMWGESRRQPVTPDTEFGTINLYRAVARVDVGLNFVTDAGGNIPDENPTAQGLANFQLKSVRLYNSLDKGTVAPLDGYGTISVPADAAVYSPNAYVDYNIGSATPDKTIREIYLAEVSNHTINTGGSPVNKKPEERCCIVVGGKYSADPAGLATAPTNYYRIDFLADGKTDATLTDILRNHRYRFNITSVYGSGYDTPEDAFNNLSVNISVNVAHWEQGLDHTDYDGQDNFQCSDKTVSLAYEAGSSGKVAVQSNVPAGEWIFENENEWKDVLTVVKPADGDTKGYITFTAKGNGPLMKEVRMKVHNLTITFTVEQSDGAYLTPDGILVNGWNNANNGSETEVKPTPDKTPVTPGGGSVTVEDPTPGSDINGGEVEVQYRY